LSLVARLAAMLSLTPKPPADATPEQTNAILVLSRAGHRPSEIARRLALARDLVDRVIRAHPRPPPPPRHGLAPPGWELEK
jgi:hypothetical protein